jgi:hypothetical protein
MICCIPERAKFNLDGGLVVHLKAIRRVCHYKTKTLLEWRVLSFRERRARPDFRGYLLLAIEFQGVVWWT